VPGAEPVFDEPPQLAPPGRNPSHPIDPTAQAADREPTGHAPTVDPEIEDAVVPDAPQVAQASGIRRLLSLALLLVLLGTIGWLLVSLFQPFTGEGEGSVRVKIPRGAGVGDIAELLEERGVVSDAFFFRARATVSGKGSDVKAGNFTLKRDMSNAAVLDALALSPNATSVSVTIPEGRARRELLPIVRGVLPGDYLAATRRSRQLSPRRYGAPGAASLEGFLFPDSYEIRRGSTVDDLVTEQLKTFKAKVGTVDMGYAKAKNLTPYDVLVVASMVDREARVPSERPMIASVIYNRLRDGIPLAIDATIRYATNNWSRPLRQSELEIDSPYNTRNRRGLPPGPIGSPGLAAIKAAARPSRSSSLYFVVKPCGKGRHAFSRTYEQFQRDSDHYERERRARGGDPADC